MLSLIRKKTQLTGDMREVLLLARENTSAMSSHLKPQRRALGRRSMRRQDISQQRVNRYRVGLRLCKVGK